MNLKTICILLTALLILVNPVFNIVEARTDTLSNLGSKKLAVGESWDMGNGWVLTVQSIDARTRSVWLELSRDGSKVDDKIVEEGQVYSWNNIFSTKISGVYAGATSDTVSLTDTYLNKETTTQKTVETTTAIPQTTTAIPQTTTAIPQTTTPTPTATVTDTQPEVQPSLGDKLIITRQAHYDRNKYNEDVSYEFASQNWKKMSDAESIYHRHGVGNEHNEKFISPDGHYEVVFRNRELVKDPANLGTYNIIAPIGFWGNIGHVYADVLPYWMWGNTPDDPTPFWNRVNGP